MRIFIYAEVQNEAIDLIELVNKIEATINDKIASKPNNYYGTEFESLYIIPTCVGDDYWEALGWSERKIISRKKREAEIRLRI